MRGGSRREQFGPLLLDEGGKEVLQAFAQSVYENYLNGTPIERVLRGMPFTDWRSKLYYKIFMLYTEGKLDFELTILDDESLVKVNTSRLLTKYSSKEV